MLFKLTNSSEKPVYQQLVDQVKHALASGRLKPGDRLPPIRELAVDLRINRNTVARVYRDLEKEGVIYSRVGQGSFISEEASPYSQKEQRRIVRETLHEATAQAKVFGLAEAELAKIFEESLKIYYRQPGAGSSRKEAEPGHQQGPDQ